MTSPRLRDVTHTRCIDHAGLSPEKTHALLDGYPVRPHFAAPGLV
ncbi:hypothetical protein ACYCAX_04375 [Pseudomonas sp. MT3]|nr:hypothetical protein [Pseudomonas sp. ATCC 13867]